jgi:hypothetical protein
MRKIFFGINETCSKRLRYRTCSDHFRFYDHKIEVRRIHKIKKRPEYEFGSMCMCGYMKVKVSTK